jgi:hypothetical protein
VGNEVGEDGAGIRCSMCDEEVVEDVEGGVVEQRTG